MIVISQFILVLLISHYTTLITSQSPPNTNFSCSNFGESTHPCETYVSYHVQSPNFLNLGDISDLFGVSRLSIATASNLASEDDPLALDQLLLVPIECGCTGKSSFANLTYEIKAGDNFYSVSITSLENLTNWQVVEALNPGLPPTLLHPGDHVILPLFCQCPSRTLKDNGIELIITYVWQPGDTLQTVADKLDAFANDIVLANNYMNFSEAINRPVLVPVTRLPVLRQINPSSRRAKNSKLHWIIAIIAGTAAVLLMLYFGVFLLGFKSSCQNKKFLVRKDSNLETDELMQARISGYLNKPTIYDVNVILEATMGLHDYYRIGRSIYRANIDGQILAVKKMNREAAVELQILQKVNHANLVRLMGASTEIEGYFFLVYEYAQNGSLDKWLFWKSASSTSGSMSFLSWNRRLQIALDVANGLQYLHEHVQPSIAHRDIRSSNILLDVRFRAKIANFSMAKSAVEPTTPKFDVFAFGVVLLELLSGNKAIVTEENGEIVLLSKEIKTVLEVAEKRVENLRNWMDPNMENLYPIDGALSLAMLARACTLEKSSARPSMAEVVFNLTVLTQSPTDSLEEAWPTKLQGEEILHICSPLTAR
ncbi:Serine/threonine receptor-like kinase NFP [Linum perenne]